MRHLATILFGVCLTALGLLAGRFLGNHPSSAPVEGAGHASHEEEHGAHTEEGEGHDEHEGEADADHESAPTLPPQTLRSLGVEVGKAEKRTFVRLRKVQAVVVDRPLNHQPVVAPLGGIVTRVHAETGQVAAAGDELVSLARDPIPRPRPQWTAELLTPLSETVHDAARALRSSRSQLDVAQRELERIRPFVGDGTVPRKTEIDLRYEVARTGQEVESARAELRAHGLTEAEIDAVSSGAPPPGNLHLWQRALERNGLWDATAERIRQHLPAEQRNLPWLVAALGELSAAGLATPALARMLDETPAAVAHFAEVASLLLDGTPLDQVALLASTGALEPTITVRAPAGAAPDWDVEVVHARLGQRVAPGQELVELYDARVMWLRLEPVGREVERVARALEQGETLGASPLLPGTGPRLDSVRLLRLALKEDPAERGGVAYATLENVPFPCGAGASCRSWQLRVGLRYLVEIPAETFADRFVLPAEALTYDGPSPVVFLQTDDTFRRQPVHVEYADEEVVVLADDGSLFEGDPVVVRGAFSLGLALSQGRGQDVDPHAGHNH